MGILLKTGIVLKHRSFSQKPETFSKIQILSKKR